MIIICCLPSLPLGIFWHLLTPLRRSICAYCTTRDGPLQLAAVLGHESSDWLRSCAMLSSVCMSRAGLDREVARDPVPSNALKMRHARAWCRSRPWGRNYSWCRCCRSRGCNCRSGSWRWCRLHFKRANVNTTVEYANKRSAALVIERRWSKLRIACVDGGAPR
jgi:hypothetical protein